MKQDSSYIRGINAEQKAAEYLKDLGWEIIKKRYKCSYGEIDLIAYQDDTLIACEVKFRKQYEDAAQSILPTQKKRIFEALQYFLSEHEQWIQMCPFQRFDVILLCDNGDVHHIENAWQVDW